MIQSFPVEEWISIKELSSLSTLCFHVVSEELFTRLISLELWEQAKVNFTTNSGGKATSEEIIPMAILITDGVVKGSLGMVAIFCHYDQVKVEPSVMLLILDQQDSHEPAMVVMKTFTNASYFQRRYFSLPFLEIVTLPEGVSTIQF